MKESEDILRINIATFFRDALKFWWLIGLILTITFTGAYLYLKYAARTYNADTTILINIEKDRGSMSNPDDMLKVYQLIDKDKNFQNELLYLQSTPLILEVIEDMDMKTSSYLQEDNIPKELTFSLRDLYKESPFIVLPDETHVQPLGALFYIQVINEEEFILATEQPETWVYNYSTNTYLPRAVNYSLNGRFKFGEVIETEYSSFRIILNSNYNADLYQGKDLFFQFNDLHVLAANFQRQLTVESSVLESTVAQMTFRAPNITMAVDFLDGLVNKYINNNLNEKNYLANKTIEYIERQLSNISDSLSTSEQQLQNIRKSYNVMNIDEKAGNLYNQIQVMEQNRDEVDRRLNYLVQMDNYFSSNKNSSKILAPSSMGLNDPLLNNLIQELTTLNTERSGYISNEQTMNPRVKTLDRSIENLKGVIAENLKFSVQTNRNELDDLNAKLRNLKAEFSSLPNTQRMLLGMERKFNLTDAVYTSLMEKRIQAQIARASNLPDCEIIEPAHYSSIASPKALIMYAIAMVVGVLIPLIFILFRRVLTDKIYNKEEIKRYTSLPVIGILPKNSGKAQNVIINNPKTPIYEAFQSMRSNLLYYMYGESHKVILVTSSLPGEGKSFTSLNLATSFASTHSKTILVQFDLRKQTDIFEELNTKALVGMSSYLINRASLDEVILPTGIPNLDIIQPGQLPPNPIELLSTKKTGEMIAQLKDLYDYVIIDTPPYGLVTDSFLLMKYVDIKIFISRLGVITKKAFSSSMEELQSKNIDNLYLLLNEVSTGKVAYNQYIYAGKAKEEGQGYFQHEKIACSEGPNRRPVRLLLVPVLKR